MNFDISKQNKNMLIYLFVSTFIFEDKITINGIIIFLISICSKIWSGVVHVIIVYDFQCLKTIGEWGGGIEWWILETQGKSWTLPYKCAPTANNCFLQEKQEIYWEYGVGPKPSYNSFTGIIWRNCLISLRTTYV